MNMQISPRKNIDLNIIEELKRKRCLQKERMTGYELELKREEIIHEVQRELFQDLGF